MIPRTGGIGLDEAGVKVDAYGFVEVDRVSRTSATGVYAAGDCTGVLMLASVAAMQGRIAMWHTLGEAVGPLRLGHVAATIFTDPEIATVGVSQRAVTAGEVAARVLKQPLATNPRAKMAGFSDGFVKLFSSPGTGSYSAAWWWPRGPASSSWPSRSRSSSTSRSSSWPARSPCTRPCPAA